MLDTIKECWKENPRRLLKEAGGALLLAVALYGMAVCLFSL